MRIMRKMVSIVVFFAALSQAAVWAEGTTAVSGSPAAKSEPLMFSLSIAPRIDFPLAESSVLFGLGGSGSLAAELQLPGVPLLYTMACIDYAFAPLQGANSISFADAGIGAGMSFSAAPWLALKAFGVAGGAAGFFNASIGAEPQAGLLLGAGIGAELALTDQIGIGLSGGYKGFFVFDPAAPVIYQGAWVGIDTSIALGQPNAAPLIAGKRKANAIEFRKLDFETVFPVFYKHYDDHPIGTLTIANKSSVKATDLTILFNVKQYMDSPKECARIPDLEPGATATVDLHALFTDKVLSITEGTKVAADIVVRYTWNGAPQEDVQTETVRMNDRNAMTWDDDRHAAAFVTVKDTNVLTFAKNVAGAVHGKASSALNGTLLTAMSLHEALSQYGITYVVDPTTPHSEMSKNGTLVDFLQFPRQTLEYKGGDCDDLSILYCALFESVGMETAFITVPGHIYMAFATGLKPEEAGRLTSQPGDLIVLDGTVWLPIEVTLRDGGFMKAWAEGAAEWRDSSATGDAKLYPVRDAWKIYEPVGLPGDGKPVVLPADSAIAAAFQREVARYVDREMKPAEARLLAQISKSPDDPKVLNQLGILYGRFGLTDKAIAQFTAATKKSDFVPALLNLGGISYAAGDLKKALDFYNRAGRKSPDIALVQLGLARVNHDMENFGQAKDAMAALKKLDPDLAARFSYLEAKGDDTSRAADVERLKEEVVWSED
jgi:hypothetical protein